MTHIVTKSRSILSINARQTIRIGLVALYGAAMAAIVGITALSPLTPAIDNGVYQLVVIHGDESDIADYNLSSSDCRSLAIHMSRNGHNVLCELTAAE